VIALTSSILINLNQKQRRQALTVDYTNGTFANKVRFDGGTQSGAHSLTFAPRQLLQRDIRL